MDNELKIIKQAKAFIRKVKFRIDYSDIEILNEEAGNDFIASVISNGCPAMIARGGATELRCIGEYLRGAHFSDKIRNEISTLSGVFPTDEDTLDHFCEYYIDCMKRADLLSLWGVGAEAAVVHKFCETASFTELHAIEPYYFDNPWSLQLRGKKILVVHPFSESISAQYEKRHLIWDKREVLPSFKKFICLKAVQSIAGQETKFGTWFEALDYMKKEIDSIDYDIAIIGAGAYGLPLAAHCKQMGKISIQMAGATQILFGIKGKRWDRHPVISKMYNDAWVRPLMTETPELSKKVEGGSYW